MNGQWVGRYTGTNSGDLFIDLDDDGTSFRGRATVSNDDRQLPVAVASIKTPDRSPECTICVDLFYNDPRTGDPKPWDQVSAFFPANTIVSSRAVVKLKFAGSSLAVDWTTDIGHGRANLPKSSADQPSAYRPISNVTTWNEFKQFVIGLEHRRYIFRGQRHPYRLRTGFHRTGRADLAWFLSNDIQTLHRHLSQRTSHIFNLNIPNENGAFFNLAQHHGYPTPLLDWTFSPYVGAFFAYQKVRNSEAERGGEAEKVRIFMFDQKLWRATFQQFAKVTNVPLHFSILEFISIDNERLIPQQSISSVTTIDDIETYIATKEREDCRYLQVIDLPLGDSRTVMRELGTMGITAGFLFPGFDGACEELRERFFDL
jgi:hypothetical protein